MEFISNKINTMKKIGVITIHSDYNYGAFLQAYALIYILRKNGYFAEIIDYRKIPNHPRNDSFPLNIIIKLLNHKREQRYNTFIKPMVGVHTYRTLNEIMNNFKENYDILISGSDQIWNPRCGGLVNKLNPAYFLAFVSNKRCKKISYASSIGSYQFNKDEQNQIKRWLSEYTAISTREQSGKEQLSTFINKEIQVTLDPTLLLTKDEWLEQAKPYKIKAKYVLVYYMVEIDEVLEYARKIADLNQWKVALITNHIKRHPLVDINIRNCGPAEFITLFYNAEYIVTNSFHGTAFSVNFNKNFISIFKKDSPQRAQSFLNSIGLSHRLIKNIQQIDSLEKYIDYKDANIKLQELRNNSFQFLKNAINQ